MSGSVAVGGPGGVDTGGLERALGDERPAEDLERADLRGLDDDRDRQDQGEPAADGA